MIRNLTPFGSFGRMGDEFAKMEKEINNVFSNANTIWSSDYSSFPKVNIAEDKEKFVIEAGLAGYSKDDIEVSLENRGLRIKGKQKESSEVKDDKTRYHIKELCSRAFEKLVIIPESVDKEKIKSRLKDGVLVIELPKKEAFKQANKVIEIE